MNPGEVVSRGIFWVDDRVGRGIVAWPLLVAVSVALLVWGWRQR